MTRPETERLNCFTMKFFYLKPETQNYDFVPEEMVCATSARSGSTSDYDEDDDDIFDD